MRKEPKRTIEDSVYARAVDHYFSHCYRGTECKMIIQEYYAEQLFWSLGLLSAKTKNKTPKEVIVSCKKEIEKIKQNCKMDRLKLLLKWHLGVRGIKQKGRLSTRLLNTYPYVEDKEQVVSALGLGG